MRRRLLEALQAGWNVSSAAAYAGVVRTNVYRMRRAWPALDEELSRIPARERFTGDPEAGPAPGADPGGEGGEGAPEGPDLAELRKLALDTLSEIVKGGARDQDRVAAARALLQATAPSKARASSSGPADEAPAPAPAAAVTPVTSEQVAKILKVRPVGT